jgi:hypothetical protein
VNQVTTVHTGNLSWAWRNTRYNGTNLFTIWPAYKPPATKVNIWVGDKLDIADASYELSYSIITKTRRSKKRNANDSDWIISSWSDPVISPDGDERFDIVGEDTGT